MDGANKEGKIYRYDDSGWCVEYKGRWFHGVHNEGITRSEWHPEGKLEELLEIDPVAEALLKYARLIIDMEASCRKRDAEWPITLLNTAHKIDELAKKLRDPTYKKMQSKTTGQWTEGKVKEGSSLISNWSDGKVFTFQHHHKEFAVAVGRKRNYNDQGLEKNSSAADKQARSDFSGVFSAQYGENISKRLEASRICTWEDVRTSLLDAVNQYKPEDWSDVHKVCRDLLSQHEDDFVISFCDAATNCKKKVAEFEASSEVQHSKSGYFGWMPSFGGFSRNKVKQENEQLREELSQCRVRLASVYSGLGTLNIADEAYFPSANEALRKYCKLAEKLMQIYDGAVYNKDSGEASEVLQLKFSEETAAILKYMWETMCSRYTQLLKDLSGCLDLNTLSQKSITECDMHCRQHWENLFMPLFPGIMSRLAEHKSVDRVHVMHSKIKGETKKIPEKWLTDPSDGKARQVQGNMQHMKALTESNKPSGSASEDMTGWFYSIVNEIVLKRLWHCGIQLFLQRPILVVLPQKDSTIVKFDSKVYLVYGNVNVEEGQTVVEVLPPVYCAPEELGKFQLVFEGCECKSRKIWKKGTVDVLQTMKPVKRTDAKPWNWGWSTSEGFSNKKR